MSDFLSFSNYHLVGIKGVAMTSLAQLLIDAGKNVTGTDVSENFVTQKILDRLGISIDHDFSAALPVETEVVIFTAAHGGPANPMVKSAQTQGLLVLSHAEALAEFFNQKQGLAVCGVGGKSTTSAMLSYIFEQTKPQSFSVGVGNIAGLNKTGQWLPESTFFVAEADEYVVDPAAPARGEEIVPRFSFLRPQVIACTNLGYDHPDVYRDFAHTRAVYLKFFQSLPESGTLIINGDDQALVKLASQVTARVLTFGQSQEADLQLRGYEASAGHVQAQIKYQDQDYQLSLLVPGVYNVKNALAAILVATQAGIKIEAAVAALATFASTMRRFEYIGEKQGVKYYDDYAHHPREIEAVIRALNEWYPDNPKVIAFQSHTFSRTKELFAEFARSFAAAQTVVMLDIFPSAREKFDPTITSDLLCQEINRLYPDLHAQNLHTLENLATYLQKLPPQTVVLTLGAGDIYGVHDLVK